MASGVAPSQRPIEVDREYEEAISPPPPGFVIKTAILPQGNDEWNSRRQDVINKLLELGVKITRHNEFVTLVTGYFRDILGEKEESEWTLQPTMTQGHNTLGGPIEAMDLWLLEQKGSKYFLPSDF